MSLVILSITQTNTRSNRQTVVLIRAIDALKYSHCLLFCRHIDIGLTVAYLKMGNLLLLLTPWQSPPYSSSFVRKQHIFVCTHFTHFLYLRTYNIRIHNPESSEYYGGIPIVGESQGQSWGQLPDFTLNVCLHTIYRMLFCQCQLREGTIRYPHCIQDKVS